MQRLYLVRHGTASRVEPGNPLSAEGRRDVRRVAAALSRSGLVRPAAIRHSGKERARETAEILADELGSPHAPERVSGLSPLDPVDEVAASLMEEADDLMLVGHLPFMDRLASLLVCGREEARSFEFGTGTVLCLLLDTSATRLPSWRVAFQITPRLVSSG